MKEDSALSSWHRCGSLELAQHVILIHKHAFNVKPDTGEGIMNESDQAADSFVS